ncbi:hypothetical protein EH31_00410 [Erythrobacter longus]|uniref:Uncharacterized protein n=1 Tax=Erythrobacter longus TaxID=1044 RepID=A0A074MCJ2_ERYLO|nr:hypothetical protein [Erythrobacter longus]KEO91159.1 hypothetical protein EH31_00410 [Erythrobacter longus]
MQKRFSILGLAFLPLSMAAVSKTADTSQTDLVVRAGDTIAMTINDQSVQFRLSPDAISVPTLNDDAARRIGLKPSMIGYVYVIGPERISFRTDNVRYLADATSFKRRTAFSNRNLVDGADAIAGPETFPFRRTIFILREPQPGDREITFPLDSELGRSQTSVRIDIGDRPIYAAFSLDRSESLITATGGKWIADANGGWFDGDARDTPILYGVARPIRSLKLERPLMLGELQVRNLAVRVSDVGSSRGIAEGAAPEQDPNEIVVSGDGKRKVPSQRMYIGMDTIGHCASIAYDFDSATVTLRCPDQPAIREG